MATVSFLANVPGDVQVIAITKTGDLFEQVKKFIEQAGSALRTAEEVALIGQAPANVLMLAAIEQICGLPKAMTLIGFGQNAARVGVLNLDDFRHNVIRPLRAQATKGFAFEGWWIFDGGGRGVPEHQLAEIAVLLKVASDQLRVVPFGMGQVMPTDPTRSQASDKEPNPKTMPEIVASLPLNKADWGAGRIVFLPAGFGQLAATQVTALYAMAEKWPLTVKFEKGDDQQFHAAALYDPQPMRQWGAEMLEKWEADHTTETLTALAKAFRGSGISEASVNGTTVTFTGPGMPKIVLNVSSARLEN
jgi:hypothetical protein